MFFFLFFFHGFKKPTGEWTSTLVDRGLFLFGFQIQFVSHFMSEPVTEIQIFYDNWIGKCFSLRFSIQIKCVFKKIWSICWMTELRWPPNCDISGQNMWIVCAVKSLVRIVAATISDHDDYNKHFLLSVHEQEQLHSLKKLFLLFLRQKWNKSEEKLFD